MRVLVISSLFPSCRYPNRGIFVLNRLKAVQQYAEVRVINAIPWFPFQSRLNRYRDYSRIPGFEVIDGIEVYHPRYFAIPLVLKVVAAIAFAMAVLPVALRLRKSWPYDLIDMHWTFPDLPAGRLLARLLGMKQMVTVRGAAALHTKEWSLRRLIVKHCLRRCDHVVTLSDRLKESCIALGVPAEKVTTIGNGVDTSRFHHLDREACRQRLGLAAEKTVLLGIGYLSPHKGFDRILRALPDVLRSAPGAELHLIGPNGAFAQGDSAAALGELAASLGLADKVHFVGEVPNDQLVSWYNAADCFCLSSRSEGCPNVLLEALACGCPAVATDVGSVSEILSDASMGAVVADSYDGVRSGLLSVLSRSFDRRRIAAQAARHDWDSCARKALAVCKRLLGTPEDGGCGVSLLGESPSARETNRLREMANTLRRMPPNSVASSTGKLPLLRLLLSFDHELSLGQSADYARDLFDPTDRVIELADELEVPLTLFTDVCCALRFREWDESGFFGRYRRQLETAIEHGHDVQLHIHPHWIDSEYRDGRFVPAGSYSLGGFRDRAWPDNISGIIGRGKELLEEICGPRRPGYQCIAYRAGGFCLAPGTEAILSALWEHGIRIDSSIAKGNYFASELWRVDHRHMPDRANWYVAPSGPLDRDAAEGLYEIPIATRPRTPWNNLPFLFKRLFYRGRRYSSGGRPIDAGRTSVLDKLARLVPRSAWLLGFDNYTEGVDDLMRTLDCHVKRHSRDDMIACSALSHPKYMGSWARSLMRAFVEQVRREFGPRAVFSTYGQFYDEFLVPQRRDFGTGTGCVTR